MTISVNLMGRLGNQLFQYANLRNLSLKKKFDIYYDSNFEWHGQKCLLNEFNLTPSSSSFNPQYKYIQVDYPRYFDPNIINIPDNTILIGYFENELYFQENESILKKELVIKDQNIINWSNNYINSIKNNNNSKKILSIHFRRGDYISECDDIDKYNKNCLDFVTRSLDDIKKFEDSSNIIVVLFTGGFRISNGNPNWIENTQNDDINWIIDFKNSIEGIYDSIHLSPGTLENNELKDYDLLNKSDYTIITFPSTFSWMASYSNQNTHKKIYYNYNYYNYNTQYKLEPAKDFIVL